MEAVIKRRICAFIKTLMQRPHTVKDLCLAVCGDLNKLEWTRSWLYTMQDAGLVEIVGLVRPEGSERGPGCYVWAWVAKVDPLVAPQPAAQDTPGAAAAIEGFYLHHRPAALGEGWGLFMSGGEVQVQRIDDPDEGEPLLKDDDTALVIVATGTSDHHSAARRILAKFNPAELNLGRSLAGAHFKDLA